MPCDSPQQADAEIDCIMLRIDSGAYSISGPELGQRARFCPGYRLVLPGLLQKNSTVNAGGRCSECGEDGWDALCITHENGNIVA